MNRDKKADDWLRKLLSGAPLGRKETEELLNTQPMLRHLSRQWWQAGQMKEQPSDLVGTEIWNKVWKICFAQPDSGRMFRFRMWSVAASILLLIGTGIFWLIGGRTDEPADEYITVTACESRVYSLPDDSKVYMQPGSSISYSSSFAHNRTLHLKGQSLFEVQKRGKSAFKVYIGEGTYIEVKGTTFWVKQSATGDNEVTLFEGEVDFNIEVSGRKITMKPSQTIIYRPQKSHTVTLQETAGMEWKDGKFHFTEIPLRQLLNTISQLYGTEIKLDRNINTETTFSGSIRYDESLQDVIEKICFSLGIDHREENGIIHINQ